MRIIKTEVESHILLSVCITARNFLNINKITKEKTYFFFVNMNKNISYDLMEKIKHKF